MSHAPSRGTGVLINAERACAKVTRRASQTAKLFVARPKPRDWCTHQCRASLWYGVGRRKRRRRRCVMRYAVCFDRVLLKAERALARLKVRLRACRIRAPHSSGMASRLPTGARHSDGGLTMTFPSLPAPCQKRSRTRPGREGRLITQTWPGIPDRVWCALP